MAETLYIVGHQHPDTDSVGSAIAYAHLKRALGDATARPARAGELNAETRYVLERFGLPAPDLLTSATGKRLVLVDHNEVAQALPDIGHATVVEVWEHHRVGDLDIPHPIVFHCEPVGATATLIAQQYLLHDIVPPAPVAGVLLAAILSDTLVFASPTCSDQDRRMAEYLAAIAGVDAAALGRDLLASRGDQSARPARDLVESDLKEFTFAGERVGIAQIEVADATPVLARRGEFLDELDRARQAKGLLQMILLVTDIGRRGSHVWFSGARPELLEKALGHTLVDRGCYVDGWMSRKKQVVPPLERAFTAAAQGTPR